MANLPHVIITVVVCRMLSKHPLKTQCSGPIRSGPTSFRRLRLNHSSRQCCFPITGLRFLNHSHLQDHSRRLDEGTIKEALFLPLSGHGVLFFLRDRTAAPAIAQLFGCANVFKAVCIMAPQTRYINLR